MTLRRVDVRVPATTANLGPGFDCLGMALDLWNLVRLEVADRAQVVVTGEGAGRLAQGPRNLVYRAVERVYKEVGERPPPLRLACRNSIPLARGLGSSAAAVVGGLVAANRLCGQPLSEARLLELAVEMEGHPDNVTPALLGGCRIVVREPEGLITAQVPIPQSLHAVLFIPDQPMPTRRARAILPEAVSREDAIYNLGRTALLVHALHAGDLSLLRTATQDRLHQPYRQQVFQAMKYIIRGALSGGALAAFLSGGGSTVLALTEGRQLTIGYEMADAAEKMGATGTVKIVRPVEQGAHVVREA